MRTRGCCGLKCAANSELDFRLERDSLVSAADALRSDICPETVKQIMVSAQQRQGMGAFVAPLKCFRKVPTSLAMAHGIFAAGCSTHMTWNCR